MNGMMALGMHNSVICAEDEQNKKQSAEQHAQISQTYMGNELTDFLSGVCDVWPLGPVGAMALTAGAA